MLQKRDLARVYVNGCHYGKDFLEGLSNASRISRGHSPLTLHLHLLSSPPPQAAAGRINPQTSRRIKKSPICQFSHGWVVSVCNHNVGFFDSSRCFFIISDNCSQSKPVSWYQSVLWCQPGRPVLVSSDRSSLCVVVLVYIQQGHFLIFWTFMPFYSFFLIMRSQDFLQSLSLPFLILLSLLPLQPLGPLLLPGPFQ